MARYFADLFAERNDHADLQTILYQFEASAKPDPADHHARISRSTIIVTGSEDGAHQSTFALKPRIKDCEMKIIYGAGHACQIEQPWLFDQFLLEFLKRHGLFPVA